MTLLDPTRYQDPLDPLRRFIPTPLRTQFRVGSTTVVVETNDFSLLPALPLAGPSSGLDLSSLAWKLVRDSDAHGLLQEPVFLISGPLTIVGMGPACLLGMDHERRELLGFIGMDVDARTFQEFLVPFLCRLSKEAGETDLLRSSGEGMNEDSANA
jgi:hypothetical protein